MLRLTLICVCLSIAAGYSVVKPGPKYPPTHGEVWPKPKHQVTYERYYSLNPIHFSIEVVREKCELLRNAIARYSGVLLSQYGRYRRRVSRRRRDDWTYVGVMERLEVELTEPCEPYPYFGMDESYNLEIRKNSTLRSKSVWGILRGLETMVQLFYRSGQVVFINSTTIYDEPRYLHRGLLLDTSRHFISVANILRTLDAMAINKMNVFHWHIVDDQSFPYQSERFPEISEKGAFDYSMVYTRGDISRVVEYARWLGIRVIPEFDVPGHTSSWGNAYPELLTQCYDDNGEMIGLGPMDPTKEFTYKLLGELFEEVQGWFPDKYFHIGGDEVQLGCWSSNPQVQKFMKQHNMTTVQLHAWFMKKAIPLLAKNSRVVVWQEVFDEGVVLAPDTLVQVWKSHPAEEMVTILSNGYEVVFSSAWYLDYLRANWPEMYTADPRRMVINTTGNKTLAAGVIGGEACMWGEMVDDRNVMSRVWPRASAVAERLWSPEEHGHAADEVPELVYRRLEEHTCRMIRRGVDAEPPSGPGYCIVV